MQDRRSPYPAPRRHHQEPLANGPPPRPFRRGTALPARTSAAFLLIPGPRPPARCSRRRVGAPRGRRPYLFTGPRARADGATARLFTARLRGIAPRRRLPLVPSLPTAASAEAGSASEALLSTCNPGYAVKGMLRRLLAFGGAVAAPFHAQGSAQLVHTHTRIFIPNS